MKLPQSRLGFFLRTAVAATLAFLFCVIPFAASAQLEVGSSIGSTGACSGLRSGGFVGIVDCVISFFNYFIYFITAATVVFIVWGAFKMLSSEDKREEGKQNIYHGIIGLFVMMSIWGFVNILDSTFRLSDDSPRAPRPIQR